MSRKTELTMPSWLRNTLRTARGTVRAGEKGRLYLLSSSSSVAVVARMEWGE
jgi:hypothetical protein